MPLLNWLNKDSATKAAAKSAYRVLEEVPELSYGDADSENLLIQGDNLEALKALIPFYAGKVKCIFIDPPYNTKSAFEHYDDNLEHSQWLSLIYPRLEILRELLSEDGSIWVTIDDNEVHYLKILCDEVFGRKNFIANIAWQKFHSVKANAQYNLSSAHDHILVYKKSEKLSDFNKLSMDEYALKVYKNPDNDPRGRWRTAPLTASLLTGQRGAAYAKTGKSTGLYELVSPVTGKKHWPSKGRCWLAKDGIEALDKDNRIWWGKDGNAVPMKKIFLSEKGGLKPANTFWPHTEAGSNKKANAHVKGLFTDTNAFSTPKPEELIERIVHMATNSRDLILDSFLGSGTTAAVAHKMNRRYIGIELGEHAITHCQPRLQKVIDGEQGGISKSVNWQGGGGFKFVKLGETVFDEYGCLNPAIKFPTLAAYIWYIETRLPLTTNKASKTQHSPLIGIHNETAYYLLFNGILGDKRPSGGNVLTSKVIKLLSEFKGKKIIYGETTRLGEARLAKENIIFKQIPYEVKAL